LYSCTKNFDEKEKDKKGKKVWPTTKVESNVKNTLFKYNVKVSIYMF